MAPQPTRASVLEAAAAATAPDAVAPWSGRRRTLAIVAAVAALALLAAGVAWAIPGGSNRRAGDPTSIDTSVDSVSTQASDTVNPTVPAPLTTAPAFQAGYTVDPLPAGFVDAGARSTGGAVGTGGPGHWFELWSSSDAARSSGTWMSVLIASADFFAGNPMTAGAERVDVGGRPGLLSHAADGSVRLITDLSTRQRATIDTFGLTDAQLILLAAALTAGDDNAPVYAVGATDVLDLMDLRISHATSYPDAQLEMIDSGSLGSYFSEPAGTRTFSVFSGDQRENDLLGSRLLDPLPVALASSDAIAAGLANVGGRNVVVGSLNGLTTPPDDPVVVFAQWHRGSQTVTVLGSVGIDVLLQIVAATRQAADAEWQVLLDAPLIIPPQTSSASIPPVFSELSRTTTGDGHEWTISPSEHGDPRTVGEAGDGGPLISFREDDRMSSGRLGIAGIRTELPFHIDPVNPLIEYNSLGATAVVVAFESPPQSAFLRVTLDGSGRSLIGGILPVGDGTWYAAAVTLSERTDYTAELVGSDGAGGQTLEH